MAGCVENFIESSPDWKLYKNNYDQQVEEVCLIFWEINLILIFIKFLEKQKITVLKSFFENTDNLNILQYISDDNEQSNKYSIEVKYHIDN